MLNYSLLISLSRCIDINLTAFNLTQKMKWQLASVKHNNIASRSFKVRNELKISGENL